MYEWADDITGEEEHERDMYRPGSTYEYCKHHPSELVSDGMFDAPCGACERAGDEAQEAWEHDPSNPRRVYCGPEHGPWTYDCPRFVRCVDVDDGIPF
jgi:hypothetical protein